MPQQPFIQKLHFYLPEGHGTTSRESGAHHVEYMGSPEKAELLVDRLMDEQNTTTSLESAAIHAKYAGERAGNMGYIGSLAADAHGAQKSILQAQGPVWRVIVSVGEADALAMGGALLTQAGWEQAADKVVPQMIKQLGLDPTKAQWIAAAHRFQQHEQNPHLHLLLWEEGNPSRKTAKWSDKERRTLRKTWVSTLYQPEREAIGKEKTATRQEARTLIQSQLAALKEAGNHTQGFQQELRTRLKHLGTQLPGQGRFAYAYMPSAVKVETESLIRWLWKQDPALQAAHDRYLQNAEQMGTFYWHRDPAKTDNSPVREQALQGICDRAEADLLQRLVGPVLKAARQSHAVSSAQLRQRVPGDLSAALQRLMHDGERAAARTAYWLAESQYQRQQAERELARSTGQDVSW